MLVKANASNRRGCGVVDFGIVLRSLPFSAPVASVPMSSYAANVVLLLTHTADHFTVDRVAAALAERGMNPVRVDTDLFPSQLRLAASFTAGQGLQHSLHVDGRHIRLADVRAVWLRKIWTPRIDDSINEQFRDQCVRESKAALLGFLDGLHEARWVDPPHRMQQAENKLLQLRMAMASGLNIPRTLVTNDPEPVRQMFAELNGAMVAKMLTPFTVSMDRPAAFVYTSPVREEDLADASSLQHCPMVFQQRIEKACELRIAYVNGELFAGAIDASASAQGQVDWRRASLGECSWQHATVPDAVRRSLQALMRRLGLSFGAIDMILTPAGEHVFLEVNPAGEWGMLEKELDLPISQAIADALIGNQLRDERTCSAEA